MIFIPYRDVSELFIRGSEDPACSCGIAVVHGGIRCAVLPMPSFRAKLNPRHRAVRASVFTTAVVALHPSFLALYPFLAYAYFSSSIYQLKSEEWDLSFLCIVRCRPCFEPSCNSMWHCRMRFQN